jgi:hypothetical protein
MRSVTKTKLLGRVGLGPGLLVLVLLVAACGRPQAVEGTDLAADEVTPRATLNASPPTPTPTSVAQLEETEPATRAVTPRTTPMPGAPVAPDFRLPDLNGQTWTLSQFRDEPVMLFFWATW